MSISSAAIAESPIALPSGSDAIPITAIKVPARRQTIATSDTPLVPEAR